MSIYLTLMTGSLNSVIVLKKIHLPSFTFLNIKYTILVLQRCHTHFVSLIVNYSCDRKLSILFQSISSKRVRYNSLEIFSFILPLYDTFFRDVSKFLEIALSLTINIDPSIRCTHGVLDGLLSKLAWKNSFAR